MQAGDTNIDDQLGGPSQIAGCELRFLGDREIGGSGGKDHHEAPGSVGNRGRPGQQMGVLIMKRSRKLRQDRSGMLLVRPGEECHVRLISYRSGDHAELLGSLSGAVDGFWITAAPRTLMIKLGERINNRTRAARLSHDQDSAVGA